MSPARPRAQHRTTLALLLALLAVATVATAGCSTKEMAIRSLVLVNRERERRGIAPLYWDEEAAAKAEAWASNMATSGGLEHSQLSDGIVTEWRFLGENVGLGETVEAVHQGFMGSASHRATLLAPKYRRVGVGVAWGDGVIYIAQVFRD